MNVRHWLLMLVMALTPAVLAVSAAAGPESKAELKEQFERRYPAIGRLKSQGKVGETFEGFVDAVQEAKLDDDAKKLIDDENRDRRKLYDLIADEVKNRERNVSADKVAERNARRNLANAKPNEYIKSKDGVWVQRQDVQDLKREGKVGETAEGFVEAVKGAELSKKQQAAIEIENIARKEDYQRDARKADRSAEEEGERAGKRNIEGARSGEYVKQRDGNWERKK